MYCAESESLLFIFCFPFCNYLGVGIDPVGAKTYPPGCTCRYRTWLFCLDLDLISVPQVGARLSRL